MHLSGRKLVSTVGSLPNLPDHNLVVSVLSAEIIIKSSENKTSNKFLMRIHKQEFSQGPTIRYNCLNNEFTYDSSSSYLIVYNMSKIRSGTFMHATESSPDLQIIIS